MSDPTKPPTLNPATFMWGTGRSSPTPPIPVMLVGVDDAGVPIIPVGPAGVEPVEADINSTPTLLPPAFLWGQGQSTVMTPAPVVLVSLTTEGIPYIVNPGKGVVDGSEAAPGMIGEYLVSENIAGTSLTSDIPSALCQIDLSPGCWEVWDLVDFLPDSNKSPNMICASISLYDDALPTNVDLYTGVGVMTQFWTPSLTPGMRQVLMTGQCRANTVAPLTVYLVGQSSWAGGGTVNSTGDISARRVR